MPRTAGDAPAATRAGRWPALAAFALLVAATQLLWLSYAPVTTRAADALGVSDGAVGDLAGLLPLVYVLLAIPTGRWTDRAFGRPYDSPVPGTLGGHRRNRVYGRLDCPGAAWWIARGHYVRQRVFFLDEATAVAAGYRPCVRCLPAQYRAWKAARDAVRE